MINIQKIEKYTFSSNFTLRPVLRDATQMVSKVLQISKPWKVFALLFIESIRILQNITSTIYVMQLSYLE